MFDFNPLAEFSRAYCVPICGLLVPANLLATLLTMILAGLNRSQVQVRRAARFASFWALVIILHVLTWFVIGTVMAPTYILLLLGTLCLIINLWAIIHSPNIIDPQAT